LRQAASDPHLGWSYERLADLRQSAVKARDSGFILIHERTHLEEVVDRIDATVRLKRERDEYQVSRKKRGAS
jgi:hypothetical protein